MIDTVILEEENMNLESFHCLSDRVLCTFQSTQYFHEYLTEHSVLDRVLSY